MDSADGSRPTVPALPTAGVLQLHEKPPGTSAPSSRTFGHAGRNGRPPTPFCLRTICGHSDAQDGTSCPQDVSLNHSGVQDRERSFPAVKLAHGAVGQHAHRLVMPEAHVADHRQIEQTEFSEHGLEDLPILPVILFLIRLAEQDSVDPLQYAKNTVARSQRSTYIGAGTSSEVSKNSTEPSNAESAGHKEVPFAISSTSMQPPTKGPRKRPSPCSTSYPEFFFMALEIPLFSEAHSIYSPVHVGEAGTGPITEASNNVLRNHMAVYGKISIFSASSARTDTP